ncbi:MAG TPA: GAF domain-containing sensor histidine kinase [Chloroflexota bacterium]|jgi:GAF domain-containing protein|nr:GAF domain-containing sensor histidine kinase [Chloroflexota bacterium]
MATPPTDVGRSLSAEGLRDLLAVVNSSRGLDEILDYLVVQAYQVLGSDGVGLYLRDPNDPLMLRVQAVHGMPVEAHNPTAPVGSPIIGMAYSKRRSVVVSNFAASLAQPIAQHFDDQIEERGTYLEVVRPGPVTANDPALRAFNQRLAEMYSTLAAVPLLARDEAYGTLVLYYHATNAYGAEQVDLSQAFAQQAALAIENAHLRAEAEQRVHEIERRRQVAEGLRDLLAVVNSNHDLDEILDEVLAQSSRLLGNDAGAVYLRDEQNCDILQARAAHGLDHDVLAAEVRVGSPTTGLAVQQGRTLVCHDLQAALAENVTRSSDTRLEEMAGYGRVVHMGARTDPDLEVGLREPRVRRLAGRFHAVISTPLIARGRAFGALTLFYAQPHNFSVEQVDLARAFAQQAALAIENARLHADVEQRMRENDRRRRVAEGMRDLLASVNSTRSLDEVLDLVLAQATDLLGSDAGSVLLLNGKDAQPEGLTIRASRGLVSEIMPARLPVGTAITGVAVEQRQPVAVRDLLDALPVRGESLPIIEQRPGYLEMQRIGDPAPQFVNAVGLPRVRDIARYYRALLAVPLMVRGQPEGAITLYYRRPREFSPEDIQLALTFADQTALAMENARLHAQTVRRSRDLEALYRADEALYRSLRLDQVLQALVNVATDVLEADMTSVLVWDEAHQHLIPGATRGFSAESVAQMSHMPAEGIITRVALTGEPISVEDVPNDPRVAHQITGPEGIRSLLHVPIKVNGEVFGVFGINYRQPRSLAGEEERILLALAHRAAVAIENARLYAESERQRHELEALYRADEALHRSLRLDDVLHALAEVAHDVLHADKTSVHIWDTERKHLVVAAAHGYSAETIAQPLIPGEDTVVTDVVTSSVFTVEANDLSLSSERTREIVRREGIRAGVGAPITVSGQFFGLFGVAYCVPHTVSADEQRLVLALAQRAGLAIHNARLFEQAPLVAAAEERQRLARELHDAVTQTLFSASLIAEVVPRIWERDPPEARQRLEELRRLTRGALAEMRTLLLELRPAALLETPLPHLLRQLAEATASRTNLNVEVLAPDGAALPLPPEVQIALYRIAQETLSNTGKHAGASRAEIHLRQRADGVGLHLSDNGRGFDPRSTPSGRLGLGIMNERARAIGARLRIQSRPGAGTRIHVHWRGVSV